MMNAVVTLVRNNRVQIDIFNASENVVLDLGILCGKRRNKILYLNTLGASGLVGIAGCAGVCKPACTLNKMQIVVILPVNYVLFTYII